jgi:kynurenine formamidase
VTRGGATYDAEVNAVTARIHDVTVPVRPGMHVLEGDSAVSLEPGLSTASGQTANGSAGSYDVFCGPVKLEGTDGAPARVLLRRPDPGAA